MKKIIYLLPFALTIFNSCIKTSSSNSTTSSAVVATVAGSGTAGYLDGSAMYSYFRSPAGVAVNGLSSFFVADFGNDAIRQVANQIVTTYAGTGNAGYRDGAALSATFNGPAGIVLDASGNLFVSDYTNNVIRKITTTGVVSTYAGTGTIGYKDGASLSANFSNPAGIALDAAGNLYVCDVSNNVIRKITAAGVVTTYAGSGTNGYKDGPALSAAFNGPFGIAVDASGNLYIADTGNHLIRKITTAGVVSTYAGSGQAGLQNGGTQVAKFNSPKGLTVDLTGNIYVADSFNNVIREISTASVVTTYAGNGVATYQDGSALSASFNNPQALTIDSYGNLYVADSGNNAIRIVAPN